MFTLTTPAKTFTAETLEELEKQLMLAQTFGSYPLWDFEEDEEWGDGYRRFDGRLWAGEGTPTTTAFDLIDYAAWSLNIPNEGITLTEN